MSSFFQTEKSEPTAEELAMVQQVITWLLENRQGVYSPSRINEGSYSVFKKDTKDKVWLSIQNSDNVYVSLVFAVEGDQVTLEKEGRL